MLHSVALGSVAVVAMAALLASSEARACQYTPELSSAVPVGAEHPANAAVILLGALRTELITATIDGVPVTIVPDAELSMESTIYGDMYKILALRFEPAPTPGQTVMVDGVACEDGPEFCPPFHIEYVAVESDDAIADGDGTVSFDLIRFTTPLIGSCNEGGSVIRTRPELAPEVFADEPFALLEVRAFHEETGLEDVIRLALSEYTFDTEHVFDETVIGPAFPLEGWCVELTVRDAAGNADALGTSCEACNYTENENHDWLPRVYPVPGGPCDDGSTTSSGGSVDTSGGEESTGDPRHPTSDSDPPSDDGPEPPDDDDDDGETSGAPAIDDGVADRGCACTSDTPSSGAAFLPLAALLVRRRSRSIERRPC